jgi:transcriptional regulator with XRE-family HTH domain
MDRVGSGLRLLRENRGRSQKWMAEQIGITEGAYSRWESGQTQVRLADLPALHRILDVDYGTLLEAVGMAPARDYQPVAEFIVERQLQRLSALDDDPAVAARRRGAWRSRGRVARADTSVAATATTFGRDAATEPPDRGREAIPPGSRAPRAA